MIDKIIELIIAITIGTVLSIYIITKEYLLATLEGQWFITNLIIFLIYKLYNKLK